MAVNIIWSYADGGDPITDNVNLGNCGNGANTPGQTIYVRHDGYYDISDVAFYMREFSGTYGGQFTASSDLAELLNWGDRNTVDDFGGFMLNFNAIGGFPESSWPEYNNKTKSISGNVVGFVHRSGLGDSEGNAVTLSLATGTDTLGVIHPGSTPGVRFQSRVYVPVAEDTIGIRQWEQVLRFNFTS